MRKIPEACIKLIFANGFFNKMTIRNIKSALNRNTKDGETVKECIFIRNMRMVCITY